MSPISCFLEVFFSICALLQWKSCTQGYQNFGTLVREQRTHGQSRRKHRSAYYCHWCRCCCCHGCRVLISKVTERRRRNTTFRRCQLNYSQHSHRKEGSSDIRTERWKNSGSTTGDQPRAYGYALQHSDPWAITKQPLTALNIPLLDV